MRPPANSRQLIYLPPKLSLRVLYGRVIIFIKNGLQQLSPQMNWEMNKNNRWIIQNQNAVFPIAYFTGMVC